jgi:lipid-A-disaccharide synthase
VRLYLVAGEASGDARGAELIRALRARHNSLEFYGAGGREMRALVGEHFVDWADEAVIGLWDVLKKYGYFKGQFDRMLAELAVVQPDALVLIDYPGFNLRLAREANRRFPKLKIIDYISPQVWAWNRGRIPKMARYLDLMLCIFPFEQPLYEESGLHAVCVGHPMLDTLATKKTSIDRDPRLVGLFPGSREKEVRRIFPVMVEAAMRMKSTHPELRFEASAASHQLADCMLAMIEQLGQTADFCSITVRASHELMQRAIAGMVCSGTATLEAAFFGLPLCVVYKTALLTFIIAKIVMRIPFIGMPNILAGREIARELIQHRATAEALANETLRLVTNTEHREALQADLAQVIASLGERGAAVRAADAILQELQPTADT